jgi:beta-glucanase (GH16 family)
VVQPVKQVVVTNPSTDKLVLTEGAKFTIQATVSPSNASSKKLTYSSSKESVATVNSKGVIKAKTAGKASITVKAADGSGKQDTIAVTVGTSVTKVSVSPKTVAADAGTTYQINAKVSPANASVKTLEYTSSDTSLATVDKKGKVTLKTSGTVKITATAADGSGKKATVTIDIKAVVTLIQTITFPETSVTGAAGDTYQLSPVITPANTTNKTLNYSSSNEAVATVDNSGKVTYVKEGTATITAATTDGSNQTATCTFTINAKDPYHVVWEDDFNGTELNTNDWNYEYHAPGWVNNELQQYVDSKDNISVKDGNLVIKAIKTVDKDGVTSYTSGRINTKAKHDYTYGKFEVRAKVPSGKGFLPAFWMMPTDENLYGQWPKCGEIDAMEVLGDATDTVYGTLHFGEPHTQKQKSYKLSQGDFANEYHVFSCEWEPNEIRFYVDGILYNKVNDWFTKKDGFDAVTYPAPYDQPFYLILNLAVGGTWPGNPSADAVFGDNAQLNVDYVKVYQKDSYNSDVQKPSTDVVLRDPDATGNYVNNGDFTTQESLTDNVNWGFMTAGGGVATAQIADNTMNINTTNAGTLDYSVQLVQPNIPMKQGTKYRLTFDAYADENRTMIADISAPDNGYMRYLSDTKLNLTTAKQSYRYDFNMSNASDPNGRLEFNLGNQGSTATVHISNVRIEKIGTFDLPQPVKSVLPDGNYVYNGEFDEGTGRLAYWNIVNNCAGADVAVTNTNNVRELKTTVPNTVSSTDQVVVKQSVAITGGKQYKLTFDAYADANKTIQAAVDGQTFEAALTTAKQTFSYSFTTEAGLKGSELQLLLGLAGTSYIDNVRIQEEGMLINGDFSNGIAGYNVYAYTPGDVNFSVDSLKEDSAACIDIANTGDADWKVQLKQTGVKLEQDKWYKISLDAKSTIDRKIMYALQKDGTSDNDWTPYSGSQVVNLSSNYQTFSKTFKMTRNTDPATILSISMGAVDGTQITTRHTVTIDNLKLEEVAAPAQDTIAVGTELLKNGDFASAATNWTSAISAPGSATVDLTQGNATYNISDVGTADWNVQLKQAGITLEKGATYTMKFKATSSVARTIKCALLSNSYAWYGGSDIALDAGTRKDVEFTFTMESDTDAATTMVVSMGKITGVDTPASAIILDDFSLVKTSE